MITEGMWQMLSELFNGEKLPDSLNKAIQDLCNGKAVVAYELTDEEIIEEIRNIYGKEFDFVGYAEEMQLCRNVLKKASEK